MIQLPAIGRLGFLTMTVLLFGAVLDATFRYPTGDAQAIAEAVKILHAEKVPKDIMLGARMFDKANVDQGGQPVN
jgi:hypothetical protein